MHRRPLLTPVLTPLLTVGPGAAARGLASAIAVAIASGFKAAAGPQCKPIIATLGDFSAG